MRPQRRIVPPLTLQDAYVLLDASTDPDARAALVKIIDALRAAESLGTEQEPNEKQT